MYGISLKLDKYVMGRKNFREQVLQGKGVDMDGALRTALPGDDVEVSVGKTRLTARAFGSMADEAKTGALSRRLGGSS